MDNKVFVSASILIIFDELKRCGQFQARQLSGQLSLENMGIETHSVESRTEAYWLEKKGLCIILQSIVIGNAGFYKLDSQHFYVRDMPKAQLIKGVTSSGEVMRRVIEMADEWRDTVKDNLPTETIGKSVEITVKSARAR